MFFWGDKSGCMFSAEVRQEILINYRMERTLEITQPREEMKPRKVYTAMEAGPWPSPSLQQCSVPSYFPRLLVCWLAFCGPAG